MAEAAAYQLGETLHVTHQMTALFCVKINDVMADILKLNHEIENPTR